MSADILPPGLLLGFLFVLSRVAGIFIFAPVPGVQQLAGLSLGLDQPAPEKGLGPGQEQHRDRQDEEDDGDHHRDLLLAARVHEVTLAALAHVDRLRG